MSAISIYDVVDALNSAGLAAVKVSDDEVDVKDGAGAARRVRVRPGARLTLSQIVERVWALFEVEVRAPARPMAASPVA